MFRSSYLIELGAIREGALLQVMLKSIFQGVKHVLPMHSRL